MRGQRKRWTIGIVAAAAAIGLAACSSSGGAPQATEAAAGGGQVAGNERFVVAMVTHEQAGDAFWDKIRSGAQAAAAKDNIELRYSNNEQGPEQASLIQAAVDAKVDGLAVTLSATEAVRPAIQAAVDAGIPVVAFNQGIEQFKEYGTLMYFGSDEQLAGETAGQKITDAGGKRVLCVIQAQGSVALETRCAGVKATAPETTNVNVNGADIPSTTSTITAALQQDPSIDYVVTLGAPIAIAALEAKGAANSQAKVVTFDLSAEVAKAIQEGTIEFSIDQQPYVQGYLAVDSLWLQLTNKNDIGGSLPVLTGPSIVDKINIEGVLEGANRGTR